jgi:hypothetical protein
MAINFGYPSNATLQAIAQALLPDLTLQDPIFDHFPMEEKNAAQVMWEQEDRYTGLMEVRGLGGSPGRVQAAGLSRFIMQPGYYGDYALVDESELTLRRMMGDPLARADVSDLVMKRQNQLMTRLVNRAKLTAWLCATGSFTNTSSNGLVTVTDSYAVQTYSAGTAWSTAATSTPLADFRAIKLKQRGYSVTFGQQAKAYMNQTTFNYLTANTNSADLYGKRTAGLATIIGVDDTNAVLAKEGLPQIVIYDDGYLNSSNTFVNFIADSKVIVVGKRLDGAPIGGFQMTANASRTDGGPGIYNFVTDSLNTGNPIPRELQEHLGFNGGPAILFPSAIVYMSV